MRCMIGCLIFSCPTKLNYMPKIGDRTLVCHRSSTFPSPQTLSYFSTFHKSDVPGDGFVSAARSRAACKDTALQRFKQAHLMLPHPMRK